jgi:hypothetical protein
MQNAKCKMQNDFLLNVFCRAGVYVKSNIVNKVCNDMVNTY